MDGMDGGDSQYPRDAVADMLGELVSEQARRRHAMAEGWVERLRQYEGRPDSATEKNAAREENQNKSTVVANKTRPKTRVMASRLADILFPADKPNWDVRPSPVPEGVEDGEAARAAGLMKEVMRDQLRSSRFADLCVLAIVWACKYGVGVIKGPMTSFRKRRRWVRGGDGRMRIEWREAEMPYFEHVDLFDWFPDMDAARLEDCNFIFQMHRASKRRLKIWRREGGFVRGNLDILIEQDAPEYLDHDDLFDSRRVVEQGPLEESENNVFHVFEYHGELSKDEFRELCVTYGREELIEPFLEADDEDHVACIVYFCQGLVLRFEPHPLESGDHLYSIFRLDADDTSLFGPGIPEMMADPQHALSAAWRAMIDNGGISAMPMFMVSSQVKPVDGPKEIKPGKLWEYDGPSDANALLPIEISGTGAEQERIMQIATQLIDDETMIPLMAHGDQSHAPQQTAHGMALLANAVNIVFRAAVRSFDMDLTIPSLTRLYDWNMQFNKRTDIKGDLEVDATGSSVLLVRDIQNEKLMMVLNLASQNPEIGMMVKVQEVARHFFRNMDIPMDEVVLTDEELAERERMMAEQEPPPSPEEVKLMVAQMQAEAQLEMTRMKNDTMEAIAQLKAETEARGQQIDKLLRIAELQERARGNDAKLVQEERLTAAEMAIKERKGTGI